MKRNTFSGIMGLLCLFMASCQTHPKLVDFSKSFQIQVGHNVQLVPSAKLSITLLQIDHEKNRGEFQIKEPVQNIAVHEWVSSGEYFRSKNLFGSRGLRLDRLETHSVIITAFGGGGQ